MELKNIVTFWTLGHLILKAYNILDDGKQIAIYVKNSITKF
jgi:hypothetical protein